jgi:hypothetical protein
MCGLCNVPLSVPSSKDNQIYTALLGYLYNSPGRLTVFDDRFRAAPKIPILWNHCVEFTHRLCDPTFTEPLFFALLVPKHMQEQKVRLVVLCE